MDEKNCENCGSEFCGLMPPAGEFSCERWQPDKFAVNRWIPCSERLPEYGEYVLFIHENCGVYVGYYDEKNTWNTDYQWFTGENVTQWMPLPEPPEKE